MDWDKVDFRALERLRAGFLAGSTPGQDYWQCAADLESYDQTFARRIGWKWDYVLDELKRRGWSPVAGDVMDWGCGTGIASRTYLQRFGNADVTQLVLCDRSPLAMQFAASRLRDSFPEINLWLEPVRQTSVTTMLLSHVLTELTAEQLNELLELVRQATSVIWVEPGTRDVSRALIAIREKLRGQFHVVAPCTHQANCGMLAPENDRHWCHHFAKSPPEVFTDGRWARFAKLTGVDLRSLPLSFLVLDKRSSPDLPTGATRVIGRPRVYKAHTLVLGCDATGVRERRLTKRGCAEEFRRQKKGDTDPLQIWVCDGEEIVRAESLPAKKIP